MKIIFAFFQILRILEALLIIKLKPPLYVQKNFDFIQKVLILFKKVWILLKKVWILFIDSKDTAEGLKMKKTIYLLISGCLYKI